MTHINTHSKLENRTFIVLMHMRTQWQNNSSGLFFFSFFLLSENKQEALF